MSSRLRVVSPLETQSLSFDRVEEALSFCSYNLQLTLLTNYVAPGIVIVMSGGISTSWDCR